MLLQNNKQKQYMVKDLSFLRWIQVLELYKSELKLSSTP